MSRSRLRSLGSLPGLLAILISLLAPMVSQTLAAHHRPGDALSTLCSVAPVDAPASHRPDPATHPAGTFHWQACPYCNLFAHLPVLPARAAPFAVTPTTVRAAVSPAHREVRPLLAHTAAQPRAPPTLC